MKEVIIRTLVISSLCLFLGWVVHVVVQPAKAPEKDIPDNKAASRTVYDEHGVPIFKIWNGGYVSMNTQMPIKELAWWVRNLQSIQSGAEDNLPPCPAPVPCVTPEQWRMPLIQRRVPTT